jgi:preprotein translocase subunit SecE
LATPETDQPKQKRRLRAPGETLREKTTKAQEVAAQPPKKRRARRVLGLLLLPFRAVAWISHLWPFKQIGHAIRWFFSLRFMRFLGKILGITYIRDSARELKLVTWPSRKQSRQLTSAVIIFSVIFGALIAIVDFGLDKLFKQVILK